MTPLHPSSAGSRMMQPLWKFIPISFPWRKNNCPLPFTRNWNIALRKGACESPGESPDRRPLARALFCLSSAGILPWIQRTPSSRRIFSSSPAVSAPRNIPFFPTKTAVLPWNFPQPENPPSIVERESRKGIPQPPFPEGFSAFSVSKRKKRPKAAMLPGAFHVCYRTFAASLSSMDVAR